MPQNSGPNSSLTPSSGRTWFITGCSTGIGRALCEKVLERGERAVCTARNPDTLAALAERFPDRAIVLPLDVTDADAIARAAAQAIERTGGIDVLVNNAGYGLVGALEEVGEDAIKDAFDGNVYGAYRLIRAMLPHMRARGGGRIVNVSSMTGIVGAPGFCFYSATKFALEGMSEALAGEVAPFGIKVTLIEPGPFRTAFRGRSMVSAPELAAYADTAGKLRKMLTDTDGKQPGDPARAADAMIAVVDSDDPPLRLPLGDLCVAQIRKKLAQTGEDLERWLHVSLSTSYEAAPAPVRQTG